MVTKELSGLDHQLGFRTAKGGNLKPLSEENGGRERAVLPDWTLESKIW